VAQLTGNVGSWMTIVATGWLVLELTDSPAALGLTGAFAALPLILLSVIGGAVADRVDRYRLLVATQALYLLPDVALAALVGTGLVEVGHIYAYALANATIRGFATPARQAFVPSLVPREALLSAIALNSILWQGAAVAGPALAGVVFATWGMVWVFYLNVGAHVLNLILLLCVRVRVPAGVGSRRGGWSEIVEGARYAWQQPTVRALLLATAAMSFFAHPYTYLMPVFARDVLAVGPTGLGTLLTMPAAGTILAALLLAVAGNLGGQGRLFLALTAISALTLLAFAGSRVFELSLAILFLVGAASTAAQTLANTLLQHIVSDRLRGRVLGFWIVCTQGVGPLGALPAGVLAEVWSAPIAVTIGASVVLLVVAALALPPKGLRALS
jgi:MFS family permease